jgi:hypothetical protein
MRRSLLLLLLSLATGVGSLPAQCFPLGGTSVAGSMTSITGIDPVDDEGRTAVLPLGFPFPMPGSTAGTWTSCVIESNGVLYLTNGSVLPTFPPNYTYGSPATLFGSPGSGPRLAPFWRDLYAMPGGWDLTTEVVPGVSFRVRWIRTADFLAFFEPKSFSATLFATGAIEFSYDVNVISTTFVGISVGNGAFPTTAAVDLAANPVGGSVPVVFESFGSAASWDLRARTLRFTPNASGGYDVSSPCVVPPAANIAYGSGCYERSDSGYQYFADAALADAGLSNSALRLSPVGSPGGASYQLAWGTGTYVPPSQAASNVFAVPTNDGEAVLTPSAPLPTPQGPQATLRLHSNGVLSWGSGAQTFPGTTSALPTAAAMLNAANAAIWFWHDYDETEPGSGRIRREEVTTTGGTFLYLTWEGVENRSAPPQANPSTLQLQLDLASGAITVLFRQIDGDASSPAGSAHLIGYSPGGPSFDGGSLAFATALPLLLPASNVPAPALAASPAPISTPTLGTTLTYTQSNLPALVPGVHLGLTLLSLGQDLTGTDLGFLGMPGCALHLNSLDATLAFTSGGSVATSMFSVPPGVPPGLELYAQTAVLIQPGSVASGQNQFGAVLTNAMLSRIAPF